MPEVTASAPEVRQEPEGILKQPLDNWIPFPKLEVAVVEKTSSRLVLIPPAKVDDAEPLTFRMFPIVVEPEMVVLPETVRDWLT